MRAVDFPGSISVPRVTDLAPVTGAESQAIDRNIGEQGLHLSIKHSPFGDTDFELVLTRHTMLERYLSVDELQAVRENIDLILSRIGRGK